jgi:hypothetical protein
VDDNPPGGYNPGSTHIAEFEYDTLAKGLKWSLLLTAGVWGGVDRVVVSCLILFKNEQDFQCLKRRNLALFRELIDRAG